MTNQQGRSILILEVDSARMYVVHKGRLPKDAQELVEWLREYGEFETRRLQAIEAAFKEHLDACNRPFLLAVK